MSRRRIAFIYLFLVVSAGAVVAGTLSLGQSEKSPRDVAGAYRAEGGDTCVGRLFTLDQSGRAADLDGTGHSGGELQLHGDALTGSVRCRNEAVRMAFLRIGRRASDLTLHGTVGGVVVAASRTGPLPTTVSSGDSVAPGEETFGRLMLAIAAIILAARIVGSVLALAGQPPIIGEIVAGILLGPSLLGWLAPRVESYLFPSDIVALLTAGADIGLAFYMFHVGLRIDPRLIRSWAASAAVISSASVAVPMCLGLCIALGLYPRVGPDRSYVPFALFMGVAMSITALPVLARILVERGMLGSVSGTISLTAAAVDDATAWALLAVASAAAGGGSLARTVEIVAGTVIFVCVMQFLVARAIRGLFQPASATEPISDAATTVIILTILLAAWAAESIGVAAVFGALIAGLVMPRSMAVEPAFKRGIEEFVGVVLLPLFFVTTGLRTDIGSLDRPELWIITVGIIAVAVIGKWGGAFAAARYSGLPWHEAAAIGALMNTRGLTELIVATIGFQLGFVTPVLFTMLVLMAVVTTLMAPPALAAINRIWPIVEQPKSIGITSPLTSEPFP